MTKKIQIPQTKQRLALGDRVGAEHQSIEDELALQPPVDWVDYYRLPRAGTRDRHHGLTRSAYYEMEKEGLLKLRRILRPGKTRGITLVNRAAMRALMGEEAK